jgi:type IV pilus assembly protein PilY1
MPANKTEAPVNNTSRNAVTIRSTRMSRFAPLLACIFTVLGLPVHAAVSLPDTPLQTSNGVPPNIWFILDDSGSMAWRYMYNPSVPSLRRNGGATVVSVPTGSNTGSDSNYGSNTTNLLAMYDQTYVTNGIYYNPSTTYRGWQRADGTFMADRAYNSVLDSDTLVDANVISLAGAVQTFYVPLPNITDFTDVAQYERYTFETDGSARKCTWNPNNNQFADNVTLTVCSNVASFVWTGPVTRTLAQEKQNFANWHSYHRTRSKLAKAGASYAFNDTSIFNADSDYRVGYTTIWQRDEFRIPVGTNNGLFTGANRATWFTKLFNATANNNTPLIPALTRAGQYFEDTSATGPWGPQATASQFECRQNFSILTTDGFWNNGATAVGNTDNTNGATITRPDGAPFTYTAARPFQDTWTNTLADVAMHYWKRDIRTDLTNSVPASASNPAFWQHMVTFGISIGLRGTLDPKVDLPALTSGVKIWPNPMDNEDLERIDDLFHASVNGRGAFVSAGNPKEFADGLGNALRAISARRGSGSSASVTSSSTAVGTNIFLAKFFSAKWYGELQAFAATPTGININMPVWSASIPTYTSRSIFTHNGTAGTTFPTPAQATTLTADVANYIRGDRSKEQPETVPSTGRILRERTSLLGTIVNSSPAYVKSSSTVETVYVGANDGMLHAFDAVTGVERFAYVPRGIDLVDLKEYSDPTYGHRFFVDGPIVTSTKEDIANKTVLVGTLGRGGRGLFALDVTDPTSFAASKVLWDRDSTFDSDMGQVLGKPVVAKLNNGSTAVLVANGLNSTGERAVLFMLDLETGAKIAEIDTGVGSSVATNGLSSPTARDIDGNGTVDVVYAGDFRGNVWKFDLSSTNAASWNVANNRPLYAPTVAGTQPITGSVAIATEPATGKRWVFFGTGRFLTNGDLVDTTRQTWYGVIDDETATASVTRAGMTARNIPFVDAATFDRAFEPHSALPPLSKGWYIDLDLPSGVLEGERMIGSQRVVKNVLIATSIIPDTSNPCQSGRGYINALDAFTGTSLMTGFFGTYDGNGVFVPSTVGGSGTVLGSANTNIGLGTDAVLFGDQIGVNGNSNNLYYKSNFNPELIGGRISWREIIRR